MAQVLPTESTALAKPAGAAVQAKTAALINPEIFGIDALSAFARFFARGGQLTTERIRDRKFSTWLRNFIAEKVGLQAIRPGRATSTQRIVALLAAKAQSNGGALNVDEFQSSMQAFSESLLQDYRRTSPEAGVTWALFDIKRQGRIPAESFHQMLHIWSALGVSCDDATRNEVLRKAREKHADFITEDLYYAWCQEVEVDMLRMWHRRRPNSEAREHRGFALGQTLRPGDQMQRSKEVVDMSMQLRTPYVGDRLWDLSESVWQPTPARTPRRKVPGALGRGAPAELVLANTLPPATLPPLRPHTAPAIDPLEQEASWHRREMRLRPNMKVLVSYAGPDGENRCATGTLLNGWGRPLTSNSNTSESEGYLAVEVFGVEKLVPRDSVTSPRSGATGISKYL